MLLKFCRTIALVVSLVALPLVSLAQYTVERTGDVVTLSDKKHDTAVSIAPSMGDLVFQMTVKGQDVVYFPYSLEAFKAQPGLAGIPFLAPWANRLDEQAFYANGKKYNFNMSLGNVRGAIPMHGFLSHTPDWEIVEAKADNHSAWLTCRLDFYRHPDWMAQFPFAQTIEITQRLRDGVLEVHTKLENLSTDPMPVAIGFHPYFQLTDSKREDWTIQVGAKTHYLLEPNKIPSGQTEPITNKFKNPAAAALKDYNLDDVFGDLIRDNQGRAQLAVLGKHQRLTVQFGPKFQAAVIYSPDPNMTPAGAPNGQANRPPRNPNFVCFEPMASITDAMNLAHAGKFNALQYIAPGGTWEESFWVIPSGF